MSELLGLLTVLPSRRMKATLIISVYKNTRHLKYVLDSLLIQTDRRFDVMISEDGCCDEMREFLLPYKAVLPLEHLTQDDLGWRKNMALNNAIRQAKNDYLIFIDGDCVLHPRFVEQHLALASPKAVLAGKRIKLDERTTASIEKGGPEIAGIGTFLRKNYFKLKGWGARFTEEGIFIDPKGLLGFIPKLRTMYQLKGCNMSFSREAILAINGFDEDYTRPAIGEDIDLTWRFIRAGYSIKSVRNMAVQYHLYHKENWSDQSENVAMMEERKAKDLWFCRNGIVKKGELDGRNEL